MEEFDPTKYITRNEKYLANMAGGSDPYPDPITRHEHYLAAIADRMGTVTDEKIVEAVDAWMDEHIDPDVTVALDDTLAVEGAAADSAAVGKVIAPQFSPTKADGYKIGDYCIHEGILYKFISAHTGAWDASHAKKVDVGGEIVDGFGQIDTILDIPTTIANTIKNPSSYATVTILSNLTFEKYSVYNLTVKLTSASGACYVYYRYNGSNIRSFTIPSGTTEYHDTFVPTDNYTDGTIVYTCGDASITVSVEFAKSNSGNKVEVAYEDAKNLASYGATEIDGVFAHGYLITNAVYQASQTRICTPDSMTADRDMFLEIASGYRIGVQTYTNGSWVDSGWITDGVYTILKGTVFKICIAGNPDITGTADIDLFRSKVLVKSKNKVDVEPSAGNVRNIANLFRFKRYFSHIGVSKTQNIIIPYLSQYDVARAKRLGFDVLEINVLKTSDNKDICMHGYSGKFGAQYEGVNGEDVSDTLVNSMTLQQIKDGIRFKSIYAKYKTAPLSLEEMLQECKRQNIIPLCQNVDANTVATLDTIMGKNNYILSVYDKDRNGQTDAPLISWLNIADPSALVDKCNKSGGLYIAGIDATNASYSSFTDSDWSDLVEAVHNAGYLIGCTTAYTGAVLAQKLFSLGFDVGGSGWEINEFESGNICNLFGESTFTDFTTEGTASDGVLSLTDGQTVAPAETLSNVFLGGGSLHIRFNGTIKLSFGQGINNVSFTSDGSREMWFSTFFEEASPTFLITASGSVSIYDITYKASKM